MKKCTVNNMLFKTSIFLIMNSPFIPMFGTNNHLLASKFWASTAVGKLHGLNHIPDEVNEHPGGGTLACFA